MRFATLIVSHTASDVAVKVPIKFLTMGRLIWGCKPVIIPDLALAGGENPARIARTLSELAKG